MSPAAGRRAGFTVLEMVVVLLVLGVVTAVAAPALFRGDGDEPPATRTAGELESLLRSARRLAVERGATTTLVVDPGSGRWWLEVGGDSAPREGALPLPAGVALRASGARARFAFHPLGGARGEAVAVQGAGRVLRVGVDPWTGEADVAGR